MINEGRTRMGVVTSWFNGDSGYGFAIPEKGGEAVFAHHTRIAPRIKVQSLKKVARVTCKVTREELASLWAKNICATDR